MQEAYRTYCGGIQTQVEAGAQQGPAEVQEKAHGLRFFSQGETEREGKADQKAGFAVQVQHLRQEAYNRQGVSRKES